LEELFHHAEKYYGVVMVFGEEAEFYSFDDKQRHKFMGRIRHSISNNHHRGGQSQNRLARLRTEQIHRYLTQVEEAVRRFYTSEGVTTISRLVISGPGLKKEQVKARLDWLKCPIDVYNDLDFKEICTRFDTIIQKDQKSSDNEAIEEIKELLRVSPDLLVFGQVETSRYLADNRLAKVWCSCYPEKSTTTEIIQILDPYLDQFGGWLGLRWQDGEIFGTITE